MHIYVCLFVEVSEELCAIRSSEETPQVPKSSKELRRAPKTWCGDPHGSAPADRHEIDDIEMKDMKDTKGMKDMKDMKDMTYRHE